MNVNINNKNLFSQSLLINKFFFQKNSSHKQTGITTVDSGCQYRNNNYYYNKDGVPFLSKEQADRCINGKDWKKIVSVSDKVKSDLVDSAVESSGKVPKEFKQQMKNWIHDLISTISTRGWNNVPDMTLSILYGKSGLKDMNQLITYQYEADRMNRQWYSVL